jgi:LPXTG-motif cell wall-anchored protein
VSGVPAGTAGVASAALPRTGAATAAVALGGIVLVAAGSGTVAAARPKR